MPRKTKPYIYYRAWCPICKDNFTGATKEEARSNVEEHSEKTHGRYARTIRFKELRTRSLIDVTSSGKKRKLARAFAEEVGKAFVKWGVDKYGDSFKDWLAGKLMLDKNEGEEVTETESEE